MRSSPPARALPNTPCPPPEPGRLSPALATRLRRLGARSRRDDGSTLPLVVAFGALALALTLVVAAASSLYLERKRLFTLADGAALVGAEAFDLDSLERTPGGWRPRLHSGDVAAAVGRYLAAAPAAGFDGLAVEQATSVDGRSATVTLSAAWHPPVVTVFFPAGLRIESTATARSVFG